MADNLPPPLTVIRQHLSQNLKIYRGKLELSQEALADLAGLHRTYVSQVERGRVNVSLDNLVVLATALGTQVSDLLREPVKTPIPLKVGRKTSKHKEGEN